MSSPPPITRLQTSLATAARRERPSVGQWLEFPGFNLARTVASLNPDPTTQCTTPSAPSPIIRNPSHEPWLIERALDAGAHGIMVPMVETREMAEIVVRAARYRTVKKNVEDRKGYGGENGQRGAGAMVAHPAFRCHARKYVEYANERIVVIVQIESQTGVQNVEDIAGVEGIDALFVGPNDLASSMGSFPFDHPQIPKVQEATKRELRAAKEKGKFVGHFALSAEAAAEKWKLGFDFVNCGADKTAVTSWMAGEMERLGDLVGVQREKGEKGKGVYV